MIRARLRPSPLLASLLYRYNPERPAGTVPGQLLDPGGVANPSHTYTVAGSYDAPLTVTDNGGATDMATVRITVIDPKAGSSNCTVAADIALSVRRNGSLIARVNVVDENGSSLAIF